MSGPQPGKAKFQLSGEFTASEMDDVIRELAKVRAGMLPAVPSSVSALALSDAEVLEEAVASFTARTLANGGLRIWLRSEGFGWLAMNLSAEQRQKFREFLDAPLGHTHSLQ